MQDAHIASQWPCQLGAVLARPHLRALVHSLQADWTMDALTCTMLVCTFLTAVLCTGTKAIPTHHLPKATGHRHAINNNVGSRLSCKVSGALLTKSNDSRFVACKHPPQECSAPIQPLRRPAGLTSHTKVSLSTSSMLSVVLSAWSPTSSLEVPLDNSHM